MTSRFGASWTGWLDPQTERALAAALRCCSWNEAEAALAELVEQSPDHPSVFDVIARVEAVRRRGELVTSRVANRSQHAKGLLRARRALFISRGTVDERQSA